MDRGFRGKRRSVRLDFNTALRFRKIARICMKAHNRIDLIGKKYARLFVLEHAGTGRDRKALWRCQCDCGSICVVQGRRLKSGHTRSCGCINKELIANVGRSQTYGAKGIKVCEFLRSGPDRLAFLIGPRQPGLSIDRIECAGHYSCGQCAECMTNGWPINIRWATVIEQARNKPGLKFLTLRGETHCLAEWCERLRVPYQLAKSRLNRGWGIEEALKPLTPIPL